MRRKFVVELKAFEYGRVGPRHQYSRLGVFANRTHHVSGRCYSALCIVVDNVAKEGGVDTGTGQSGVN